MILDFLLMVIDFIKEKLNSTLNSPPAPSAVELESNSPPAPSAVDLESNLPTGHANTTLDDQMSQRLLPVFGACFAAVNAVLKALQMEGPLPTRSQLVITLLVISLTANIVSFCIYPDNKRASLVGAYVGIFIVATALVVAFVANLQTPYMVISIAAYSTGILFIIFVKIFKSAL